MDDNQKPHVDTPHVDMPHVDEPHVYTPHVYDGIVEQNNPMPMWWIILFYLCVCFSFLYYIHYEIAGAPTLMDEYKKSFETYKIDIAKNAPAPSSDTEESLMAFMKGEDAVHSGRALYKDKCAMCHGEFLEGKIGPNLTDHYWTTGDGSRRGLVKAINEGSAAKGMPGWSSILKPDEVKSVAAFVYSKIDSNPPNAKPPEGAEIKK